MQIIIAPPKFENSNCAYACRYMECNSDRPL
jgi:hypothetical protein